jgi:hypothetical protein
MDFWICPEHRVACIADFRRPRVYFAPVRPNISQTNSGEFRSERRRRPCRPCSAQELLTRSRKRLLMRPVFTVPAPRETFFAVDD